MFSSRAVLAHTLLRPARWLAARSFHVTSRRSKPFVGPDGVSRRLAVVALGGNALLKRGEPLTLENQTRNARVAVEAIAKLAVEENLCVCITHGNGPQVGMLAVQSPETPLDVLDAQSGGSIGYLLESEMANVYAGAKLATVLTQVVVDPSDKAFQNPTKFIGKHYTEAEADHLAKEKGWVFKIDGKHGPRRVVPSPAPKDIVQLPAIELLLKNNVMTVCCGGGGIPVARDATGRVRGIEAVVDKDAISSLLTQKINADIFLVLTDTPAVMDPTKWPEEEKPMESPVSVEQLRKLKFPGGSIGPKVEAVCDFVEKTGGIGAIGNLADALQIIQGSRGTQVRK